MNRSDVFAFITTLVLLILGTLFFGIAATIGVFILTVVWAIANVMVTSFETLRELDRADHELRLLRAIPAASHD